MSELSPFATNARAHLIAIDRALGSEVRDLLQSPNWPPDVRARMAVDLILAHVARTTAIASAADAEPWGCDALVDKEEA